MINNPPELAHYTKEKLTNCQYFLTKFNKFWQKKTGKQKIPAFQFSNDNFNISSEKRQLF